MKKILNINNKKVTFEQQDNQVFCTSLDIARVFEKRHADILRIIDELYSAEDMREFNVGERNFALTYKDTQIRGFDKVSGKTRKDKIYLTSRDGFSFVAMGLTGKEARKWKISFIDAFNYMENELRTIKDNATATLEQPKEVFNLIYETPCREAVLKAVKNIERDKKAKVHSIKEYTITEKFKGNKAITNCEIGVQWDTPPLLNAKNLAEIQALNQRKRKYK